LIKRFRRVAIATLAVSALALTACSGTSDAVKKPGEKAEIGSHSLVFAHITAESFPYQAGALKFKELLEKQTDGKMTVKVYPGGQLGGERDINESILTGSVHIGVGAGALATLAPIMNLLEMPFMIQGQDHMNRIIESPVGDKLAAKIHEQGKFKVLDWFSTGDSSIQTTDVSVKTPADMKGLKLRAIENPALAAALQALGANPTPMPYGEVYTGIQTGVVKGATLDWGSVNSMKLHELVKHATSPKAAFLAEPRPVIMSDAFWKSLNKAEQDAVTKAMTEAAAFERQTFKDIQDGAIKAVKDAGVQISEIDIDAFLKVLKPVWDKWAKDLAAEDILKGILDLRK
jgi:tripartite ATP-independent transporter DctP family solute receptor